MLFKVKISAEFGRVTSSEEYLKKELGKMRTEVFEKHGILLIVQIEREI